MGGNSEWSLPDIANVIGLGFSFARTDAGQRFLRLMKNRMEESGDTAREAQYAVGLTAEGRAAWEEARKASLGMD